MRPARASARNATRAVFSFLRTFGWLAGIVYGTIPCLWLAIHPWARFWRSRTRSPHAILLPAWVALWIALGFLTAPDRHIALYGASWTWLPAAALLILGIGLYRLSGRSFTLRHLSGLPELTQQSEQQKLIVTGVRQRVRHPIYAAHLCELTAWALGTGLAVVYAMLAFGIVTGWLMIWLEERELVARFGSEYRDYQARVPMLIPRIGAAAR